MPSMVSNQRNANAIGNLAIKKVIGKTSQISPSEFGIDGVKSSRVGCRESDDVLQFLLEFVAQNQRDLVVTL